MISRLIKCISTQYIKKLKWSRKNYQERGGEELLTMDQYEFMATNLRRDTL